MNFLDIRTILISYAITNAICAAVMASLWFQNRKRSEGLGFWLADFILQFVAVLLITLRGILPDLISVFLGTPLVIAGTILLYIGLESYTGKSNTQLQNYILLAMVVIFQGWFSIYQPNLQARNLILSIGLFGVCSQCCWLLLHRVDPEMRPNTKAAGFVFLVYSLVSLMRIFIDLVVKPGNDLLQSNIYDTAVILIYQMVFIGLTFALFLMVNRHLVLELENDIATLEWGKKEIQAISRFPAENPNPILRIKRSGCIIYANPASMEILAAWGREVGEDVPDDWCEKIRSAAETGASSDVEIDHNGRKFICTLTPIENEDYVNIYGRDITERRRAEDLLRVRLELMDFSSSHSMAELLQRTLDVTGDLTGSSIGFYHFVDEDQKNLSLQAWSTRTLEEYCKAEGKGMHYPIEEAGVWVDCVREKRAVIHNDYATLPHRKGLPQGHAELVRELVVPILHSGNVVAILGVGNKPANYDDKDIQAVTYFAEIAWEIAERKRSEEILKSYAGKLEAEVNERTHELREAQEKLVRQEKLAMLGQLSGSVSHELRNPLGVISNAVYYLNMIRPDMDEKMRRYLEIIDKETHTADKIITDLLDYSRIKSLDREPAVVADLVGDVLKRFPAPQGVELVLKIPKKLPKIHTDPTHLGQVLGNLIMNAYQAMPTASLAEGPGCTLTITAKKVDSRGFSARDGRTYVAIAVKDSGVGIAPEHLSKIFEPLFTTKARGIGLGLAICKSLVEANGGQIEVQSEQGQGSTFTIYVPVYKEAG